MVEQLFFFLFFFVTDCTSKSFLIVEAICLVLCMYLTNSDKKETKNIYYCEMCFVSIFHCNRHNGSCKIVN